MLIVQNLYKSRSKNKLSQCCSFSCPIVTKAQPGIFAISCFYLRGKELNPPGLCRDSAAHTAPTLGLERWPGRAWMPKKFEERSFNQALTGRAQAELKSLSSDPPKKNKAKN